VKILIFTPQFHDLGGAERSVVELAEELNRREIHTDILGMYTRDIPGVLEAEDSLLRKGIPAVHYLGMKVHPSPFSMISSILRLRRLIREQRYDIVETSMLSPSVIAAWALRGLNVSHVVGLRHVYKRDREKSWQHKVLRFSARQNNRISYYAISNYCLQHWVEFSGTPSNGIRCVYNSIPNSFFQVNPDKEGVRNELGLPNNSRIVLYVGRYAAYKAIDTILWALEEVLEEQKICILYIGSPDASVAGTNQMLNQMEERIRRFDLSDKVRFLGQREDIPRMMASADVLVHATRTEAFGRTLAEALAVGLQVVASDVEAIPEVLKNTDSILIEPDNPKALRDAVLKTLSRTSTVSEIAKKKGLARAQKFRIDIRTNAMIELFNDVLSD
jgi:glycosyltransferase involved in cell wall biosynthesis